MDSTKKTTLKDLFRDEELGNHNNAPGVCSIDSVQQKKHKTRQFVHFLPQNTSVIDSLRSLRFDLLV